jgi:hypothetical protein
MAGAQAVRSGVAAADDHHALAGGRDGDGLIHGVALAALVLLGQKLHGKVDALELATGDIQVARAFRAA